MVYLPSRVRSVRRYVCGHRLLPVYEGGVGGALFSELESVAVAPVDAAAQLGRAGRSTGRGEGVLELRGRIRVERE